MPFPMLRSYRHELSPRGGLLSLPDNSSPVFTEHEVVDKYNISDKTPRFPSSLTAAPGPFLISFDKPGVR